VPAGLVRKLLCSAVSTMDCVVKEPMKSILDRSFKYTPSASTDLRNTFAKAIREQRLKANQQDSQKPVVANIFSLKGC
jgi:hypothetical protein